ncbi:hypothetical protein TPHA_0F01500 [Tetrapisispora phaffii CBS 4417]|uniref:HORMA domain-containing protein n=1 Tax=Tetrapisispora phaffii (strain ATCC 24235 / CBS 4417 / NBRC 1672 / NRRL Y-8282 / UCD 70-5) TaxID=1071381 RepID=G8BV52_TETPH|nr:hypothetical protein TPHA_0F01500 [Tetrapisispora phaffii CBS 4417]CCE63634.1 hypothetical protein TPHA_0F01500 [Tetrapisispora phaffii CBS 4417]
MNELIEKWIKVYLKSYINLVLYHRNVYPSITFELTTYQAFTLPKFIPINRHQGLQQYIEELINDVLSKLIHIFKVSIGIIDKENNVCIEKYVLDFGEFQHLDDISSLTEMDVYNEFRSSLNCLITQLEDMPQVKDDTVAFQVFINTVEYNPLATIESIERVSNEDIKNTFDRAANWTKCEEHEYIENLHENNGQPKVKLISLIGCDIGPFVIYNYIEQLMIKDMNHVYSTLNSNKDGTSSMGSI